MSVAARDTSSFFPAGESREHSSSFGADIGFLCASLPDLRTWLAAERDQDVMLMAQADLAYNDASVHTAYFEARRPMEIGAVIFPGGTVPGGFSALTAEIRVTRGDASEASGMNGDTPVSIYAGTRVVMSVESDTSLADSAQLWYLDTGDKVRIKVVPTGTSATMAATQLQFQLIVRER